MAIIEHKGRKWFLDKRLREIRNINNPHDFISFDNLQDTPVLNNPFIFDRLFGIE